MNRMNSRWVLATVLGAMATCAQASGTVQQVSGTLTVQKPDGAVRVLSRNSEVVKGDTINTERDSFAQVKFADGAVMTVKPNTRIRIEDFAFNQEEPAKDTSAFALLKGGLRMITGLIGKRGNPDAMRLGTATATIGIRGTTFTVDDCITTACQRRGGTRVSAVPGGLDYAAVDGAATRTDASPDGAELLSDAGEVARRVDLARAPSDPFALAGERVAQAGQGGGEDQLPPSVYVGVSDGEVIVSNGGGAANFRAGQFASIGNFNARPVTLPGDPGLPIFQPPLGFFQSISGSGVNRNSACLAAGS